MGKGGLHVLVGPQPCQRSSRAPATLQPVLCPPTGQLGQCVRFKRNFDAASPLPIASSCTVVNSSFEAGKKNHLWLMKWKHLRGVEFKQRKQEEQFRDLWSVLKFSERAQTYPCCQPTACRLAVVPTQRSGPAHSNDILFPPAQQCRFGWANAQLPVLPAIFSSWFLLSMKHALGTSELRTCLLRIPKSRRRPKAKEHQGRAQGGGKFLFPDSGTLALEQVTLGVA